MAKTKVVMIDDSAPVEEVKKEVKKKLNPNPETMVVEKTAKKLNPNPETEEKKAPKKVNPNPEDKKQTADKKTEKKEEAPKQTHGKKYLEAQEKVERNKRYPVTDALNLAKEVSYSKFGGTIEVHINTNVKNLRGLVSLPFASGKSLKIMAFGKGAEDSGADFIGDEDALKEIEKGKISFDVLVTSPDMMPRLARSAKVLGPRGIMPNPKNGTISNDLKKAVAEIKAGKVEYKTEKNAQVVHLAIGKVDQDSTEIAQNLKILLNAIGKTKAKKVTLSPSMGPGVKVDIASI